MSSSHTTRLNLASLLVFLLAMPAFAQAGEPTDEDLAKPEKATEMATDDDLVSGEQRSETTEGDVLIMEEVDEASETDDASNAADAPKMMREADFPTPTRGMSKQGVRDAFGDPDTEHPAIGDPPITRWDYDRFSVFFEYDKVLHSVITE